MRSIEATLKKMNSLDSPEDKINLLRTIGIDKIVLSNKTPLFGDETGKELIQKKLDFAISVCTDLIPSQIYSLFHREEDQYIQLKALATMEKSRKKKQILLNELDQFGKFDENDKFVEILIQDFKTHIILNTWAATTSENRVNETNISPVAKQIIDKIELLEETESDDSIEDAIFRSNNKNGARKDLNTEWIRYIPRSNDLNEVAAFLAEDTKNNLDIALPFTLFTAIYKTTHNHLKNIKGKRASIDTYMESVINLQDPERMLHKRYWRYFYSILEDYGQSIKNINKVIFEREYNLLLATVINRNTENLTEPMKNRTRQVLSLTSLLPNVMGRELIAGLFNENLNLPKNSYGTLSIFPNQHDYYKTLQKFAADVLSMSLVSIPMMESVFLCLLDDEEKAHLKDIANELIINFNIEQIANMKEMDHTLTHINQIQNICSKQQLVDIAYKMTLNSQTNCDFPLLLGERVERIGEALRDKYFSDFVKSL